MTVNYQYIRIKMEKIRFNDYQKNYVNELFESCESDQPNLADCSKVTNLLLRSGLNNDILRIITVMCGISTNIIDKTQFFAAMKLISAVQAGKSASIEYLTDENLPAPNFANDNSSWDDESFLLDPDTGNGGNIQTWRSFVDQSPKINKLSTTLSSSSSPSSSHSDDSSDDVFIITDEQRDYYTKQFHTMQPDRHACISGTIAKDYFEKSRLPVHELAQIWQLSDLNCDGLLSLEEFCIAMHLVVLRRNKVELPDVLPSSIRESLRPYQPLPEEPFSSDLPQNSAPKQPDSPNSQIVYSRSSSNVSSPAIRPTNFDFTPISPDPDHNIMQPVALRMSPLSSNFHDIDETARPRPTPKKTEILTKNEVMLPAPPSIENPKHLRSSSMDATISTNLLMRGANTNLAYTLPPPTVPPRPSGRNISHQQPITDLTKVEKLSSKANVLSMDKHRRAISLDLNQASGNSANELEFNKCIEEDTKKDLIEDLTDNFLTGTESRRDMLGMLRTQRNRNATLTRLNAELNQELQEVMEQRIALEIQLEHLRPFT